MKHKDIHTGMAVYHSLFVHWGKGVVKGVASTYYARGKRYAVCWENQEVGTTICRVNELRKTPNKKKQKQLQDLRMHREFKQKIKDRTE